MMTHCKTLNISVSLGHFKTEITVSCKDMQILYNQYIHHAVLYVNLFVVEDITVIS